MPPVTGPKITTLDSSFANGDNYGDGERRIFRGIQTLVMPNVKSISGSVPGSPANGDTYIVGTVSGLWAGQLNNIAYWAVDSQDGVATTGIWEFYVPQIGWTTFNQATGADITWNGTAWATGIPLTGPSNSILTVTASAGPVEAQLLTAATYAILGATPNVTFSVAGNTVAGGNVGCFPALTIVGGGNVTYTPPAAQVTATAQNQTDLTAAITFFNALTSTAIGASFASTTFTATPTGYNGGPGFVGKASAALHFTGGLVTLDGGGLTNPVFVFQVVSALNVDTAATTFHLIGGATAANVVWVVGSSAVFDAHDHGWVGDILAVSSITLNSATLMTLNGRALANTGAVTVSNPTAVTVPAAGGAGVIGFTANPTVTSLTTTGILTVGGSITSSTNLTVNGTLTDGSASVGTSGQVLSSTGTKVAWVTPSSGSASSLKLSPLNLLSASGAIPFTPSVTPAGTYLITLASAAALTIVAPTAGTDDGKVLIVQSNTGFAHTLTATGLFHSGTSGAINLATFSNSAGATIVMMAYQGFWNVISLNSVVIT